LWFIDLKTAVTLTQDRASNFNDTNVSGNSLSLVVSDDIELGDSELGWSGDNDYAGSAHTSFIVNFVDGVWAEGGHGAVQDVYNDLLGYFGTPNSETYNNFFGTFAKNQYDNWGNLVSNALHEGVITVENDENSGTWKINSIEGKDGSCVLNVLN
jgi:hypothetical protein